MSKRDYTLGKRAEQMAQTRRQILDAGRALFAQEGFQRVSMAKIAKQASVTRATIYNHFDSKAGLLVTLLEDLERRAGIHRLAEAMNRPDPVEALRAYLRDHCRFWEAEVLVFRNVFDLSAFDSDLTEAIAQKERDRKAAITKLVRRLSAADKLRPTVTQSQAVNTIWLLSHFETFDFLYQRGALDVAGVADILVNLSNSLLQEKGLRAASG